MIRLSVSNRTIFEKMIEPLGIELKDEFFTVPEGVSPEEKTRRRYFYIDIGHRIMESGGKRESFAIRNFIHNPLFSTIYTEGGYPEIIKAFPDDKRREQFEDLFIYDIRKNTPYYVNNPHLV